MNKAFKSLPAIFIALAVMSVPVAARADGIDPDVLHKLLGDQPPADNATLFLTDNEDKIIRLDQDAATVIVNNPDHVNVMLDSPRLLIVMPRAPGATSFSVLDAAGNAIMHKNVIVSNVTHQYVRIQRICDGNSSCTPTSYYYCPNGCYQVTPVAAAGNGGGNAPPPPQASNPSGNGGGGAAGSNSLQTPTQKVLNDATGLHTVAQPSLIP
ncbi:MAG: pilus assembly protein N-terminal domain-containing protein [Alphaproteobacteria bacterium]|nr:pilus assembly protein N-terminal domain-containing protein [Alphaproteobacteria bacterium]